jgi:calcium-dependent protein kinase
MGKCLSVNSKLSEGNILTTKKSDLIDNEDNIVIDNNIIVTRLTGLPLDYYKQKKKLGEGSYGQVWKVEHIQTGLERAMKKIEKNSKLKKDNEKEVLNEINILRKIDHPNIVKIFEFFNTNDGYYLITEYLKGGELFHEIVENAPFSEEEAGNIMFQIISAVNYCHNMNIIHRDLKPENILIESKSNGKYIIKIIDFGTAKLYAKNKSEKKIIGSSYYIAPEVLTENYNQKCDLWSCGVIMYILLSGKPPFADRRDTLILEKIKIGKFDMDIKEFSKISKESKDLILNLLEKNPKKRFSAEQALNHDWFRLHDIKTNMIELDVEKIKKSFENIKKYNPTLKLQQVVIAFLVHNIPQLNTIKDAYKIFLTYDDNLDGKITKKEMTMVFDKILKLKNSKEEIDLIFKKLDNDNNGYIEYEEFLRASIDKEIFVTDEILKFAFNFFDKDSSGEITFDEIKEILCPGREREVSEKLLRKIIEEIDKDGNYVITFNEFKEMMEKILLN